MDTMIPQNPGGVPDPTDLRDFEYEKIRDIILGAPSIDWDAGYTIPQTEGIKVEDQDGSSSCVGQSWSKYAEVLEKIENTGFTDLSAKYIYSQIFLQQSGAYIRDGAKLVVNQGVAPEHALPSYPATEADMRRVSDITEGTQAQARVYRAKSYASIWHKNKIDTFAEVIQQNNGCVTGVYGEGAGWQTAYVSPPTTNNTWGHAVYCVGYFKKDGKKYIKFINSWGTSWGDSGYGYLGEDYFNDFVFSAWTLVDLPNHDKVNNKVMVDKELLQLIYNGIFHRDPDPLAETYIGRSVKDVLTILGGSEEHTQYDALYKAGKAIEDWARQ